jgi:hypothetical protein
MALTSSGMQRRNASELATKENHAPPLSESFNRSMPARTTMSRKVTKAPISIARWELAFFRLSFT